MDLALKVIDSGLALLGAILAGVWAVFRIRERVSVLETRLNAHEEAVGIEFRDLKKSLDALREENRGQSEKLDRLLGCLAARRRRREDEV